MTGALLEQLADTTPTRANPHKSCLFGGPVRLRTCCRALNGVDKGVDEQVTVQKSKAGCPRPASTARTPCPSIHSHPPQAGNHTRLRLAPGWSLEMAATPTEWLRKGLRSEEHWSESSPLQNPISRRRGHPQRCVTDPPRRRLGVVVSAWWWPSRPIRQVQLDLSGPGAIQRLLCIRGPASAKTACSLRGDRWSSTASNCQPGGAIAQVRPTQSLLERPAVANCRPGGDRGGPGRPISIRCNQPLPARRRGEPCQGRR